MTQPTDGIDGKVVAITGAGSGIGAATAAFLADRGAAVVLGARRLERVEQIADDVRSRNGRAVAVQADVTQHEDLRRLVATAVETFGRLDVLVNNAGVAPIGRVDQLEESGWSTMVDVNLRGVLHGTAAALPVFRQQGRGHVVTVASLAGLHGVSPTMAVYAATKNAVRTFMEGLRAESMDGVVRTTTISPGVVRTDLPDGMGEAARAHIRTTMRQYGIAPEAIARTIGFAVEQPDDVEISELTVIPTVQG